MPSVTFLPDGLRVDCAAGETVCDVAQRAKVRVETACVGKGTCGLCRVRVADGADALSALGDIDEKHLGNVYFVTKVRLACQARVSGDVTVEPVLKKRKNKRS